MSGKPNLVKGKNSCKSRPNATVELDLYNIMVINVLNFNVNISIDDIENSGKQNFRKGQTCQKSNLICITSR